MSLKGFHVVFIVLASLCSLGSAVWALTAPADVATSAIRTSGWLSGAIGVLLILYGVWFVVKKSRKLIV